MRAWTYIALLALAACNLGDDTADGARAQCAEGGELNNTCSGVVNTPEDACWRMVDCGAINLSDPNDRDWKTCVADIEAAAAIEQKLMMACIGAATCDQLKADRAACFRYGDN
jgi:hypothetical protein